MPSASQTKVILVAIIGTFMVILDSTIVNIALPHIIAVFNDTVDRAQLVISAYLMATGIGAPLAPFLSARFGMKRVYLLCQAGFLAGSVLCGLAWNTNTLVLFRIIQGLCGGLLSPLTMAFLFMNVPEKNRGSAMALFGIPLMLGPAIGPTLGGWLVDNWGWRMCFYVNVPVVTAALFMGLAWISETSTSKVSLDYKGLLLAALGFSAVLWGFSYAPSWGWTDSRIVAIVALGIISLVAWVMVELREKSPLLDLRIFSYGGYSLATGVSFVTTIGLFSAVFLLPLFLQNLRGLPAFNTGLVLLPGALGAMITMPISGFLYDRVGPRLPALAGLVITGLASLSLQTVDVTTPDSQLQLILLVRSMGMGLVMMPVMTFALASVPPVLTAQASSLSNVTRTVFASLGTAVFVSLLDNFQKVNLAMLVQTVTPDSPGTMRVLSSMQVMAQQAGLSFEAARQAATSMLYQFVTLRASVMAFEKVFLLGAIVAFMGILPSLFLPHGSAVIRASRK